MTEPIPIFNPELRRKACCLYGDTFAVDLLVEYWQSADPTQEPQVYQRTCPACGAQVFVRWDDETAWFGTGEEAPGDGRCGSEAR